MGIIRKDAGENGYSLKQINYYSIVIFALLVWFALIHSYRWFSGSVEKLSNSEEIFNIVIKNLGFYVAYALSEIPYAIFVGMGKTKYNAITLCSVILFTMVFGLFL